MCIRDREAGGELFANDPDAAGLVITTATGPNPRDRRSRCSVSYTHLRAHETVLDLVCRLLLEKKKKQKCHGRHSNITVNYRILIIKNHESDSYMSR